MTTEFYKQRITSFLESQNENGGVFEQMQSDIEAQNIVIQGILNVLTFEQVKKIAESLYHKDY